MRAQGIVIKRIDVGEYNQIIHFYTEHQGKLAILAKSVKKHSSLQAAHLEPFNLVDFRIITSANMPIIASAQSLENFLGIKANLTKQALGFLLLECFDRLVYENEYDPALWEWLLRRLHRLEQCSNTATDLAVVGEEIKSELPVVLGYNRQLNDQELEFLLSSLSARRFASLQFIQSMLE